MLPVGRVPVAIESFIILDVMTHIGIVDPCDIVFPRAHEAFCTLAAAVDALRLRDPIPAVLIAADVSDARGWISWHASEDLFIGALLIELVTAEAAAVITHRRRCLVNSGVRHPLLKIWLGSHAIGTSRHRVVAWLGPMRPLATDDHTSVSTGEVLPVATAIVWLPPHPGVIGAEVGSIVADDRSLWEG